MRLEVFKESVRLQNKNKRLDKRSTRKPESPGRLQVHAMRAVVQRVRSASVEVDGKLVSSIGPGLLCLIGVRDTDTVADQEFL